MPKFIEEQKIEYDFILHFSRNVNFPMDVPLKSPATDDFGNIHAFDGLAYPVITEMQNYRQNGIKTSIYFKVHAIVYY